jgi:hypothetical protein
MKWRMEIQRVLESRGLTSVMNATKWNALRDRVLGTLPFPPPYQEKYLLEAAPVPEAFDHDVWYHGDWDAVTQDSVGLEWLRVRPRKLVHRGRLVPDAVEDVERSFLDILHELRIPYQRDGATIVIYGYVEQTGLLHGYRRESGF